MKYYEGLKQTEFGLGDSRRQQRYDGSLRNNINNFPITGVYIALAKAMHIS